MVLEWKHQRIIGSIPEEVSNPCCRLFFTQACLSCSKTGLIECCHYDHESSLLLFFYKVKVRKVKQQIRMTLQINLLLQPFNQTVCNVHDELQHNNKLYRKYTIMGSTPINMLSSLFRYNVICRTKTADSFQKKRAINWDNDVSSILTSAFVSFHLRA